MKIPRGGRRWGLIVLAAVVCARYVDSQTASPTQSPSAAPWTTPTPNTMPRGTDSSSTSSPISSHTLAPTLSSTRIPSRPPQAVVDVTLSPTLNRTPGPTQLRIPSTTPAPTELDASYAPTSTQQPTSTEAPSPSEVVSVSSPTPSPTSSLTTVPTPVVTPSPKTVPPTAVWSTSASASGGTTISESRETPSPVEVADPTPAPTSVERQEGRIPSAPPSQTPPRADRTHSPAQAVLILPTPPLAFQHTQDLIESSMLYPSATPAPTASTSANNSTMIAESTPAPMPSGMQSAATAPPTPSTTPDPSSFGSQEYAECDGLVEFIGNGYCTILNNNADCAYDGGDCCACTCTDSVDHLCSSSGFQCEDPDAECNESAGTGDEATTPASPSFRRGAPSILGTLLALGVCTALFI